MTQENKELLLRDLCARFPYGVKCKDVTLDFVGTILDISRHDNMCKLFDDYGDNYTCFMMNCKPYLFPLSSMTEEQLYNNPIGFSQMLTIKADRDWENITINRRSYYKLVDWFNKNNFDYRGLIEKGLAIDATGLNIY